MITTHSARVAIAQATAFGRETRERMGRFAGSTPQIAHAMDCATVLSAVEDNPPAIRNWLLTAYAAPGYAGAGQAVIACQAEVYAEYTRRWVVRADPQRLFVLAGVVMYDLRQRYLGDYSRGIGWYAGQVRFKRQNWSIWVRAIGAMADLIDRWDRAGLAQVARALPREAAA